MAERLEAFDAHLARSPWLDRFWSSGAVALAAKAAFFPEDESYVFDTEVGFIAFMRTEVDDESVLVPLGSASDMSCTLVGSETNQLARVMWQCLEALEPRPAHAAITGIGPETPLFWALMHSAPNGFRAVATDVSHTCYRASLDGGWDGFLGRRSKRFRGALRRCERRAVEVGVEFEHRRVFAGDSWRLDLERMLAIETRSWKPVQGAGLARAGMPGFCEAVMWWAARTGRLRVSFASWGGEDIAYAFGACIDETFYGVQMSFDRDLAHLSPGNLVQADLIRELVHEGVGWYDLGTDREGLFYKSRWGEWRRQMVVLAVIDERDD